MTDYPCFVLVVGLFFFAYLDGEVGFFGCFLLFVCLFVVFGVLFGGGVGSWGECLSVFLFSFCLQENAGLFLTFCSASSKYFWAFTVDSTMKI